MAQPVESTLRPSTTNNAFISSTDIALISSNGTMEIISNLTAEAAFNMTTAVMIEVTSEVTGNGRSTVDPVFYKFCQFAYVPVTSLGFLGNVVSLWVWTAETTYNSTVFMLMALALWDALYCLSNLTYYILVLAYFDTSVPEKIGQVNNIFTSLTQVCSVNVTLMSSVTRLAAVYRPATFNLILSKPRVVSLCVAVFLWSLLLISPDATWRVCDLIGSLDCSGPFQVVTFYRQNFVYDYLAFCLPIFLLLLCNMATVIKVRQQQRGVASSNQKRGDRSRRLSITMVTISLTSLLSYPVAVTVRLGLNPGGSYSVSTVCDMDCFFMAIYCSALLTALNSSINVVYYCAISTRFVELLRFRMNSVLKQCICCRN